MVLLGVGLVGTSLLGASDAYAEIITGDVNGDGLADYSFPALISDATDANPTALSENSSAKEHAAPVLYGTPKLADAPYFAEQLASGAGRARISILLHNKGGKTPNWASFESRASWRETVASLQGNFLSEVSSTGKLDYLLENVPVVAMEANITEINYLATHPDVRSIEAVRIAERHLAQGVGLVGAYPFRSQYRGAGASVAIIDDGVDYNHPNLGGGGFPNSKVIGGFDFADNDAFPFPSGNATAHGTACAGISAGNDQPTFGDYIGGVAPDSPIIAMKIFSDSGGQTDSGLMAQAWDWCITNQNIDPANPILIISNSIGGGRFFTEESCDSAVPSLAAVGVACNEAGISIFASAGNEGYCNSLTFPGCFSSVFGVGASFDRDDILYGTCVEPGSCAPRDDRIICDPDEKPIVEQMNPNIFTGYSNVASFLSFVAPAETAFTTDILGPRGYNGAGGTAGGYSPANPIDQFSGTSAATPYAAGAAAVIQGAVKQIGGRYFTREELGAVMTSTGTMLPDPKSGISKPRPNIAAAINALPSMFLPATPANFVASPGPGAGVITLNWSAAMNANGYRIFYDDDPIAPPFDPAQQASFMNGDIIGPFTSLSISGFNSGTRYYFAIESYNNVGKSDLTPISDSLPGFDVPQYILRLY